MRTVQQYSDDFLFHCRYEKNLSPKTLKAYRIDLTQFEVYYVQQSIAADIRAIDKQILKSYLKNISAQTKPKTVKRKMATLKAFFNYLEFEDIIVVNPFRKMRIKIQEGKQLPRTIEVKVIRQLFRHLYRKKTGMIGINSYTAKAIVRDIAVLELLFETGLRVFELCNLRKDDVDLGRGYVKVLGKGKKERIVPICTPETTAALKDYYQVFKDTISHSEYFFINRLDRRLSEQSVRFMIKKYAGELKITDNITPHMFRHSIATLLLEREVDIRYIQDLLGHSSISTTQIYLQVNRKSQRKILTKKHPRQHMTIA